MKDILWRWFQGFLVTFFCIGVVLVVSGVWFGGKIAQQLWGISHQFSQAAGRNPLGLAFEAGTGFLDGVQHPQPVYRWLLLGTDEVEGSNRSNVLTDTILVVSYRPETGQVQMLSIPRDLYIPSLRSKVNTLYGMSNDQFATNLAQLPRDTLQQILGITFDRTVVVRMTDVASLIDQIGGIEIEVPNTFTDDRYPRDGVDVTKETNPKILYESLTFEAGKQSMDGARAVKYMRTRKSFDAQEGTDEARTRRQRQVINAVLAKVTTTEFLANPTQMGSLYRWYAERFLAVMPLSDLSALAGAWQASGQNPELGSVELPLTAYPSATDSATLFVHPSEAKYGGQWVYEPVDPSWKQLQEFVKNAGL